ncbi:PAS domain-containing protein, partial [Flavihumibacter petaseus]
MQTLTETELMDTLYLSIAYITAGIALLSGIINVLAGLYSHGERTDLVFGIMCLCGFFFLVLPPGGFVMTDKAPYPVELQVKRIFIWLYYALLPVFIEYYTGYKKRVFTYLTQFFLLWSYYVMATTHGDRTDWYWLSRIALITVLLYGLIAVRDQFRRAQRKEAKWLLAALLIYGILLGLSVVNEGSRYTLTSRLGVNVFFPLHLNLVAFIVIIGIRLRVNTQEKYHLEKSLRWRDMRWNMLVQNMHLLIIELDRNGNISYLNPYAAKKLGGQYEKQLLGKPWFETFAMPGEAGP